MGDYNDPFMRNQNASVQARPKPQSRTNVLQLKLIGQSHPTGLTANLLKLFEPRRPLEFKLPPEKRKCPPYTGMAQFVSQFAEPGDPEHAPPVQKAETAAQRKARIHHLRLEKGEEKAAEELKKYDPNSDPNISGDPYKTLFVAKLGYETSESKLKRDFESYGPIKQLCELKVRIVHDAISQKPKGYAFVEYMHTRDMKAAYKQADGRKIDGRRVIVDVERGRTVPNWRPRRLGGGLGTSRVGEVASQRHSGRDQAQSGAPSRSEEPRTREDQYDRDREKAHERGRDRDRDRDREHEKSRERSQDKPKDWDHRNDRRHRDRDRKRDRDHGHNRERGRDRHDRDRNREWDREWERRPRDRERGSERDYELGEQDRDRDRSHDRASEYDRVGSRPDRDQRDAYYQAGADDDREHGQAGPNHDHGHYDYYEHQRKRGRYDGQSDVDGYDHYPDQSRPYDQMDEDNYQCDRTSSRDLN